jgi:hypothetical protein
MQEGYPPQYAHPPTTSTSQAPLLPIAPRPLYQEGVPNIPGAIDYGSNVQGTMDASSFMASGGYGSAEMPPPMRPSYNQQPGLEWGPPKDGRILTDDPQRASYPPRPESMYTNYVGLEMSRHPSAGQSPNDPQFNDGATYGGDEINQAAFLKRRSLGENLGGGLAETAFETDSKIPLKSDSDATSQSQFMPPPYRRTSTSESLVPDYPFIPGPQVKIEPLNAVHTWKGTIFIPC